MLASIVDSTVKCNRSLIEAKIFTTPMSTMANKANNNLRQLNGRMIFALLFVGALFVSLIIVGERHILGWFLLASAILACLWIAWRWGPFSLVLLLLGWLPFQNGVVALLSSAGIITSLSGGILILLKEVVVIGLLVYAAVIGRMRRWLWIDLWFALFVIWCMLHLPFGSLAITVRIAGLRMLILPITLYFVGRFIPIPGDGIKRIWQLLLVAYLLAVILGGLEYTFVSSDLLWQWQTAMQFAKGQTVGADSALANELGGLFFTAFVSPIDGTLVWVRRMTSSYLEPLALGYALVLPLVFIFYCFLQQRPSILRPRWVGALLLALFGVSQVLTISRGAILATIVGVGLITLAERRTRLRAVIIMVLIMSVAMAISPVRAYILNTIGAEDPSSRGHLAELQRGWQLMLQEPWGLGLGQGGYVGTQYANEEAAGAGESFYFALSSQVGVVGLTLFGLGLMTLATSIWRYYKKSTHHWSRITALITLTAIIGYWLAAITSEGALGFLTSGTVWVLAGLIIQLGQAGQTSKFPSVFADVIISSAARAPALIAPSCDLPSELHQ